jgi:hypothetical protein
MDARVPPLETGSGTVSRPSSTSEREWRGYWWLPGNEEEAVPGILHQTDGGEVRLELIGGFDVRVVTPMGPGIEGISHKHDFPLILGTCGNDAFTLVDCFAGKTEGGFMSHHIVRQTITAGRGLRGIHLEDIEQEAFKSVTVSLEYLLGWLRQSTLEAKIEFNDRKWTGSQSAASTPVEPLTAAFEGLRLEASVRFTQFQIEDTPRGNQRRLANQEWAELDVDSDEPTTFTKFDGVVKALSDLMTLVAHAPAGVLFEHLWAIDGDGELSRVEVMGRRIHQPKPLLNEAAPLDYLFTQDDLPFADVLPRWLELHERAWLGCGMLFGLRYIPGGYTSSRLLTVATAAEAIHRGLRPDATHLPKAEFKAMRHQVLEAFPMTAKGKKIRAFLNDYLFNDVRYKDRLLALAAIPDGDAVHTMIRDVPKWAKYLKESRNGLAHGDRPRVGPESRMIFDTLEVTYALLGLVFMSELGLSAAVQRQAASGHYLNLIIAEFNRALSDM